MPKIPTLIARFWSKVNKDGPFHPVHGQCWEWTASTQTVGYGQIILPSGMVITAHRLSYELNIGLIPQELQVLHRCDNRKCVNPEHLFLGTRLDNMRDMAEKGRGNKRGATYKLTKEQILDIRKGHAQGEKRIDLAKLYQVDVTTIDAIVKRVTWKSV